MSRTTVRLTGWRYGLRKVSLDVLIRDSTSLRLNEAFGAVNCLLDGGVVELEFAAPTPKPT